MTTAPDQFVHLHVHTCYSLLDGIIRPDDLVARAVEYKMPAVAITDHGTMFGVIQFYMEAVRAGIKPIIGCECYVAPRTIADKTPADHAGLSHLVLLAETMEGYRNLCRLATIAQQDGFFHKPRIDKALLQKHAKGLIGLSACLKGEIPQLICMGRQDEADAAARQYCDMLGDNNFFLEVQNNGLPEQETVNNALLDMSRRLSIPLVGTNDCHYLDPEDSRAHEIALRLQTGQTIHDTDRLKFDTNQLNFKSTGEMCVFLEPFPRAAANTVAIAERCQVAFDFSARHFPVPETPPGKTMTDMLEDSAMAGLKKRWQHICKQSSHADKSVYEQRLAYELAVINEMGAPGYFLIIADFIAYAKNNGILTGPGRGSAPGSLVCYCLGITGVDPIEHGLLFERFLNPERKSMPDIDVDICINGRETIHQYLMDKYNRDDGEDYAACIATLGTMRSRAALREVGRALNMPLNEVDKIARLIPPGARSLDDALQKEPALGKLIDSNPEFGELMSVGRKLEGLPFHVSKHAAGIVLGDKPLTCYTPLYRFKGEMITQLDARSLETMGLARLDLLGMRDLTVISDTLQLIKNQGRQTLDLSRIDTTDAATCQLLSKGDTFGVFQLASTGMKELLVKARPRSLSEVAALIALYRPGLLENGMVADYLGRKQGLKDTTYPTAKLEPILKETCGLPVYQEQIMQAVQVLAGYTPGQSDDFRKAMGKRIAGKIADHRQRFINGAAAKGIDKATALQLFEQLEYFGAYGFNKAHSIAYAFIAWQMACLKAHFPAEFMAVWLDISFGCVDRIARLIGECRDSNIPVLPPDVNQSARQFTVVNGQIRCGLACVRKTDKGLIDAIIAERTAAGPFVSLSDFCNRMSAGRPELLQDRKALENLVKAGAFDSTGATRSQMMAVLDEILKPSLDLQQPRKPAVPALPEIGEWSPRLRRALEKRAMGICLTPAPPAYCHAIWKRPTTTPLCSIYENPQGGRVAVDGIWKAVEYKQGRDGCPMALAELEDNNAAIEVVIPAEIYESARHTLLPGRPVIVEGRYECDEVRISSLQAERIIPLTDITFPGLPQGKKEDLPRSLACPFCGHAQTWLRMEYAPPGDLKTSTDMEIACQLRCGCCRAVGPVTTVGLTADRVQVEIAAIGQWNQRAGHGTDDTRKLKPCAFCGHHPPDIEYVIDPDPLEEIETGVINQITCPQCGAAVHSMCLCDACLTKWNLRQ